MEGKKVIVTLGKDGSIKTEAKGFKGGSCKEATKFLQIIFETNTETLKPSYYEEEKENDLNIIGLPSGYCG